MFAIILFDSGIWKALSFLLLIIAAIAMGYRNFIQEQEARPKIEGKVEKIRRKNERPNYKIFSI